MATLKQIKGTTIQFRDADPVVYAGSWSSSGALNTARTGGGLTGSLTAGLYFGGNTPPSSQVTEEYNGTAWANGNNMTETARDQMYGWGTQTASISAAGVTGADGLKSKLVENIMEQAGLQEQIIILQDKLEVQQVSHKQQELCMEVLTQQVQEIHIMQTQNIGTDLLGHN